MAANQDKLGIVYSLKTGLKAKNRLKKIRMYLDSLNVQYDILRADDDNSVERLTKMLCDNAYKTVAIIGGDGTINDAINGIMTADFLHKDFAFGIIPSGSANDFVKFWGIQLDDYKLAIDSIIGRRVRRIDVGVCEFKNKYRQSVKRYFLNCVNIGLGAKLVELAVGTKVITGSQKLSNISTMIGQIFERKSFKLKFKTDSEVVKEKVMSVCIGNTTGYGQTPNAVPYNGMLDMSVITRPQWWQIFEGFWLLEKGQFLNYNNVHPYRIWNVEFQDIGKARVSLDGRIIPGKVDVPLVVEIIPDKLPLIIPK